MSSSPRCLVRGSISPSIHVHESLTRSQNGKDIDEFFHLPHIAKPGETISSTSYEKRAGGKGANQAYALARAGGVVELEGYIGEDGEWVKGMLGDMVVGVERILTARGEVSRPPTSAVSLKSERVGNRTGDYSKLCRRRE